ncbi:MAG: diadenylate cyclase CdaA [Anaerolineae bacterium]
MEVFWILQTLDWIDVVDILVVAIAIFLALQLIRGTQAVSLLRGTLILLLIVWLLTNLVRLVAFSWLVRGLVIMAAVAVPIIFQQELRRAVDMVGRARILTFARQSHESSRQRVIREICAAAERLSERRHGGLIVLEREISLREYVETGVRVDAVVTDELLTTTFWPKTELHDGAVIISADRIAAAACVLPLSAARQMPDRNMGLRHRAALGISEVSDAVAVVISEENGSISLAANARIIRRLDSERLYTLLNEFYGDARQQRSLFQRIHDAFQAWGQA